MSEEQTSRKDAAAKIMAAPQGFKVCEGCGSIVVRKAVVCPNCNAYRFDNSAEAVIHQAKELAKRQPLSVDKSDYQ